jgi:hypothetical protein
MLDPIEKPFNQISLAVADFFPSIPIGPIGLVGNVGYRSLASDLGANPISIKPYRRRRQ